LTFVKNIRGVYDDNHEHEGKCPKRNSAYEPFEGVQIEETWFTTVNIGKERGESKR
jgi:hypothetical protein